MRTLEQIIGEAEERAKRLDTSVAMQLAVEILLLEKAHTTVVKEIQEIPELKPVTQRPRKLNPELWRPHWRSGHVQDDQ